MSSPIIRFNDFKRDPVELRADQLKAVQEVIDSGWYVLGNKVKQFEQAWSSVCHSQGCVGVASGLDALEIALRGLGVGPGDEVITTPLTAFATILAIQRVGAVPVFADIDSATACLDPASVQLCISDKTAAVIVVHLYGRAADLASLKEICDRHEFHLIEDCAQAHLATFASEPVGSFGSAAAWSFYPTKNLGALGDAGAITSQSADLLEFARKFRNYGQTDRYHHDLAGQNSRLDEMHAAILSVRLAYLHGWTAARRNIAKRYWENITHPNIKHLQPPAREEMHVHHLFVVLLSSSEARMSFQQHLKSCGVESLIHYPVCAHRQRSISSDFRISPASLKRAETHSQTCVSLPIHPYLTDQEVNHVIASCNSWR